jgi:hypothetical protein
LLKVRKGRWIYEIGDHGTVVIAAPLGKPTDHLMYVGGEGRGKREGRRRGGRRE